MEEVHVYVERPADGEQAGTIEDLGETLGALDRVSGVDVSAEGNVVAVSYEGGREGREEIKRAIEAADFKVLRFSVRSDFEEGPERGLWDI